MAAAQEITIIDISKQQGSLDIVQEITFTFQTPIYKPGTNDTISPYIHQTIIDPTKTFLLTPDLSADLIHVFSISPSYTIQRLSMQVDLSVKRGHGPRHGIFYQPGHGSNKTYLYVVMETANMVHVYEVFYNANKTLSFNELQDLQLPVPSTAAAAEIRLTVSLLSFPHLPTIQGT
jgi:6-phosphogluconolactonase (cycloisomerase 2 family)